jgi:23S rRNA (guanosine2251-2'-O)-methyltransferase
MSAPPEIVYGRRAVRELLRAGSREVREVAATERALAAEQWLREWPGLRVRVVREREASQVASTRDHQGVVATCAPYRYADAWELATGERPLIVCLDGVTDPHNLGAVCRSAEAAGASGVVVPERASARVTPAVCKASAGAVEHLPVAVVVNLARYLEDIKRDELWIWAVAADESNDVWSADLGVGAALVLGAEGAGLRPSVRRACDAALSIPLLGEVDSLNVSVAAGIALFEAARQRLVASTPEHG